MKQAFANENDTLFFSFEKQTGTESMPRNHFHDAFEIYYLLSGEKYYFIKDRTYHIKKGNLVIINRYELHRTIYAGVPVCERFLVNFRPDIPVPAGSISGLVTNFSNGALILKLSVREQALVEDLFFKMLNEVNASATGFEEMLISYLLQLLVLSVRFSEQNKVFSSLSRNSAHEKAAPIVQYINSHFQEPLTLSEISRHFYISPYYLCKIFKEYTGFTFVEYLNSIRVKEAMRLLRETKYSIMEISQLTGFGSISHFGRVFKEVAGSSPISYRKACASSYAGGSS